MTHTIKSRPPAEPVVFFIRPHEAKSNLVDSRFCPQKILTLTEKEEEKWDFAADKWLKTAFCARHEQIQSKKIPTSVVSWRGCRYFVLTFRGYSGEGQDFLPTI
jgi:hypothetical protein